MASVIDWDGIAGETVPSPEPLGRITSSFRIPEGHAPFFALLHDYTVAVLLDRELERLGVAARSPAGAALLIDARARCATPEAIAQMHEVADHVTAGELALCDLRSRVDALVLPFLFDLRALAADGGTMDAVRALLADRLPFGAIETAGDADIAAQVAAIQNEERRELRDAVARLEMEVEALEAAAPTLGAIPAATTVAIDAIAPALVLA